MTVVHPTKMDEIEEREKELFTYVHLMEVRLVFHTRRWRFKKDRWGTPELRDQLILLLFIKHEPLSLYKKPVNPPTAQANTDALRGSAAQHQSHEEEDEEDEEEEQEDTELRAQQSHGWRP